MLSLHTIKLKGFASFKEAEFHIRPGITAIYGLNRSAGKASKDRNGVGKSALFASVPEIIYDEPIVGERADKATSLLKYLDFSSHGQKIEVERRAKGRGEAFNIKVDGVEQKFRTPTIARQFIRKSWPLTIEDYNTYVHIDSRISHPLVMGTSSDRKRFFTKFFGLDKIDAERKLYVAELNKLKRVRAAFDELRIQYNKAKQNLLDDETLAKYRKLEQQYSKKVQTLQDQIALVQNTLRLMQFAEASAEQLKELEVACQGEIDLEEFKRAKKDNRLDLEDAEQKLEDAHGWEQYQRDNQAYVEAYSKVRPGTIKLIQKYGLDRLKEKVGLAYRKQKDLQQGASSLAKEMSLLHSRLEESPVAKVSRPQEDEGDLETLRRAYKHQLEHASKFKRGKCETCGQLVKIKDPEVLRTKLEAVVKKLNQHKKAEAYEEDRKQRRGWKAEYEKLKGDYEVVAEEEKGLDRWVQVRNEILDLPKPPQPFKGKKLQVKVCRIMVEEIKERRSLLQYMEPHMDTVMEFLSLTKKQIKEAQDGQDLNDQVYEAQSKWTRVQTKLKVHETFAEQVQDMRSRLVKMKRRLREEEPLTHLVKGYQDKNLKKMAIEAISERLMVLVNKYAQHVFPERFTFEFKWDTQIRLLVHRHYGNKPPRTSDVRRLSGAESTFFTLVLVCALLAFVPDRKRCNVLILDEPAARLSDERKETFKNLLKTLNSLIPSVIVITPYQEQYEGAHCFTVVKDQRGVARIVEGHPSLIK
jgi:hypothetical protein